MSTERDYIEVIINQKMRNQAEIWKEKIPANIAKSMKHGFGRFVGCLGETFYVKEFNAIHVGDFNYDVIINNETYEVKSKHCNSCPKPNYECTVFAANINQQAKYYTFTRILTDYSKGWILGYITKEKFHKKSKFLPEGSWLEGANKYSEADGYQLQISDLTPFPKDGILTF